jgi:DNA-binding SARP family transcriptional activator
LLLSTWGHSAPKDYIAENLWPEDLNGLRNLHAAVHDLREWLGEDSLVRFQDSQYSLAGCEIDADIFEERILRGRKVWSLDRAAAIESYSAAISIYAGHFLPGELYAEWIVQRRKQLGEQFIEGGIKLADAALATQDFENALELTSGVRALDEAREDAVRIEMRALAGLGRRAEALRRYEGLKGYLDREFKCKPDPATETVRASVQA